MRNRKQPQPELFKVLALRVDHTGCEGPTLGPHIACFNPSKIDLGSISFTNSPISQTCPAKPASMAGVTRRDTTTPSLVMPTDHSKAIG
jgi:hypothetical protein